MSIVWFDLYQQMGTEQEAKSALNRPLPLPSKPQGGSEPKKVLDDPKGGAPQGGSGAGTGRLPPRSARRHPQAVAQA